VGTVGDTVLTDIGDFLSVRIVFASR
jgi:hypothetical protein